MDLIQKKIKFLCNNENRSYIPFSIPSLIIWIGFFDHKCIEHVKLRNFPLSLNADPVICALIVHIVLADVLLYECDLTAR
jgi:hypothetical protein